MKKLKVAILMLKSIDGTGVTIFSMQHKTWLEKNNHECDIISLNIGKSYVRAANFKGLYENVEITDLVNKDFIQRINEYDVVILNSYPDKTCELDFLYKVIKFWNTSINKPIKVNMMHEIKKPIYTRIPNLPLYFLSSDVVITFDTKGHFAKDIKQYLPEYIEQDRFIDYTLPLDLNELDLYSSSIPFSEKTNGILYLGRSSSLKAPDRLVKFQEILNKKENSDFTTEMLGIEKSPSAYFLFLQHPLVNYINKKNPDFKPMMTNVRKPYFREVGMKYMADFKFSSNFYHLSEKEKDNYGNRMEYSMMESAYLTVPVFDEHWAKNNFDISGRSFFDIPYSAIYINANKLEEGLNKLIEVSKNEEEWNKYNKVSTEVIRRNYDADIIIEKYYQRILDIGKGNIKINAKEFLKRMNKKPVQISKDLQFSFSETINKLKWNGKQLNKAPYSEIKNFYEL